MENNHSVFMDKNSKVGIYMRVGSSEDNYSRPAFKKMITDIRNKKIDTIVVSNKLKNGTLDSKMRFEIMKALEEAYKQDLANRRKKAKCFKEQQKKTKIQEGR